MMAKEEEVDEKTHNKRVNIKITIVQIENRQRLHYTVNTVRENVDKTVRNCSSYSINYSSRQLILLSYFLHKSEKRWAKN